MKRSSLTCALSVAGLFAIYGSASAGGDGSLTTLRIHVPPAVAISTESGAINGSQILHIGFSIPPRDPVGMQTFADKVSNPESPIHGQFITPIQFGQMFGATTSDVNNVVSYLKSQGFKIKLVADSHLTVLADCTVAQAEAAFHTQIGNFIAPENSSIGKKSFFSFEKPLQLPANIAPLCLAVSGLENYTRPVPKHHNIKLQPAAMSLLQGGISTLTPTQTRTLYNLAPIYNAGMTGTGRTLAISSFDGFRLSNVPLWYSQYNLPTPAGGVGNNITVVPIDGGSGGNTPGAEGDLDIQMVLGEAPTLHFHHLR